MNGGPPKKIVCSEMNCSALCLIVLPRCAGPGISYHIKKGQGLANYVTGSLARIPDIVLTTYATLPAKKVAPRSAGSAKKSEPQQAGPLTGSFFSGHLVTKKEPASEGRARAKGGSTTAARGSPEPRHHPQNFQNCRWHNVTLVEHKHQALQPLAHHVVV